MESRLTSWLTVVSVAITAVAASYIVVGPGWAGELSLVTALSLAAWVGLSWRKPPAHDAIVGPYLLTIVLVLALSTCRYLSNFVSLLGAESGSLFNAWFPLTSTNWFVVLVVAPISVMLLGGYYLTRYTPLGVFMAWWTACYASVDGLLQMHLEFSPSLHYTASYHVGAAVAGAQLLAAVRIFQQLLRPRSVPISAAVAMTPRQRNLWTLLFASGMAVYGVTLFTEAGPVPVIVVVGSMLGGLIGWRKTTASKPADPAEAVPLFLLLLTLFYVHIGEEALTSFNRAIAAISGKPWNDHDFLLLIGLGGPIVWFLSAWSLWHRQALGNFIFWFLIVGMILGEPVHLLVFPVVAMIKFDVGYQYFSGMYTSLFPMIPAIIALVTILKHRSVRGLAEAA